MYTFSKRMLRLAINGLGRIGRSALKIAHATPGVEVVAINDLTDTATLAYLLRHDSNYGAWEVPVDSAPDALVIDGRRVMATQEKDPSRLPWKEHRVDVVLECTGLFLTQLLAEAHVRAGAKHVVLSAPAKEGDVPTFVRGVNCGQLASDRHAVVSNASCTTNAVAPLLAVLQEEFGVAQSLMTTIHGYTASQSLVDAPRSDVREGRAAAENMIPTSTGAARAVLATIPALHDRFEGMSVRVPIRTVSLIDLVVVLEHAATPEDLVEQFERAAATERFAGILGISHEPLVSSDYIGDARSSVVDAELVSVVGGTLAKVVAWYDNEWGYAHRLVELATMAGARW